MDAKIAAVYVRGTEHTLSDIPCQDRAGGMQKDGVAVIALSDGAGSCPRSEQAAECAVRWALAYVTENFEILYNGADQTKEMIRSAQEELCKLEMPMEECYCTLLFFAVREDGRYVAGHIGDGFIFLKKEERTETLSLPENGIFCNETYFLSQPPEIVREHLRLYTGTAEERLEVLLTSDGCGDALYDWESGCPAPVVSRICSWLENHDGEEVEEALRENLEERFSVRSDDDLSIALLLAEKCCREQGE